MTIGSQVSFNSTKYDIDKTNKGKSQTSVRQAFASELQNASTNNTPAELEKLKTLAVTQAEKDIVETLSKGASAKFDPDADGPMQPVEISFGAPKKDTQGTGSNSGATPTNNDEKKTYTGKTYPASIPDPNGIDTPSRNISQEMAAFVSRAMSSGGKMSYVEFNEMFKIAERTGNKDDLEFLKDLAQQAKTLTNDKKDTIEVQITNGDKLISRKGKIDTTPPPEGRGGFSSFLDSLVKKAEEAIIKKAGEVIETGIGKIKV